MLFCQGALGACALVAPWQNDREKGAVMEMGRVKFYNSERRFGFIIVMRSVMEMPEELFFRLTSFAEPIIRFGKVVLSDEEAPYSLRTPQANDHLVFERGHRDGRQAAMKWAYLDDFRLRWEQRPLYRLVRKMPIREGRRGGLQFVVAEQLWCGKDIVELSFRFPRPHLVRHGQQALQDEVQLNRITAEGLWCIEVLTSLGWVSVQHDPRMPYCCIPEDLFLQHAAQWGSPPQDQDTCIHAAKQSQEV